MVKKIDVIHSAGWLKFGTVDYGKAKFYALSEPDVVVVLALVGKENVVLERQYRPAVGRYLYELPAGHVNKGESHAHAAGRELREETGYKASRISPMLQAYDSPGILRMGTHHYLATGLTKGRTSLDRHEMISVKTVPLKRAMRMIQANEIEDAKTIVGLLYYSAFMSR